MPKGEKVLDPKQKDHTTIFKIQNFNWYNFIGYLLQKWKPFQSQKPSWQLRGELFQGELLFSQRKKHLKQGENFKILKMLLEIIFLYLSLFAKEFEKTFPKDL
jgi:hypothetical protein